MVQVARVLKSLDPIYSELTEVLDDALSNLCRYGLTHITDQDLGPALESFLEEQVPPHFFVAGAAPPASGQLKWSRDPCGLLINTWKRCWLAPRLAKTFTALFPKDGGGKPDPKAMDVVLATTIIADTFMWTAEGAWNQATHALDAARAWSAHLKRHGLAMSEVPSRVLNAVMWHHGTGSPQWSPGHELSAEVQLGSLLDEVYDIVAEGFPLRTSLS